jgi:hypothetical protein
MLELRVAQLRRGLAASRIEILPQLGPCTAQVVAKWLFFALVEA